MFCWVLVSFKAPAGELYETWRITQMSLVLKSKSQTGKNTHLNREKGEKKNMSSQY